MKFLSISLVLITVSLPVGGAQPRVADRELAGFNGSVRTVSTDVAPICPTSGAPVVSSRALQSVDEYDRRGDLVASSAYANGDVVERDTFRYGSDGTRLGETRVRSAAAVFAVVSTSSGRSKPEAAWRAAETKTTITYDERGYRLVSVVSTQLTSEPTELSREAFTYDDEGRVVETRRLATDGSPIETIAVAYEATGRPASEEVRRADGSLVRRVEYRAYELDPRGNWIYRTELETDARDNERSRRARWRAIEYYESTDRHDRRAPKTSDGDVHDGVASATRPRRVHALAASDSDVAVESSSNDVQSYTLDVSDDGAGARYVATYTTESPYGMTRPRRVFPLRQVTTVVASSSDEGTPTPEASPSPVPKPSREHESTGYSFTDVPTR